MEGETTQTLHLLSSAPLILHSADCPPPALMTRWCLGWSPSPLLPPSSIDQGQGRLCPSSLCVCAPLKPSSPSSSTRLPCSLSFPRPPSLSRPFDRLTAATQRAAHLASVRVKTSTTSAPSLSVSVLGTLHSRDPVFGLHIVRHIKSMAPFDHLIRKVCPAP